MGVRFRNPFCLSAEVKQLFFDDFENFRPILKLLWNEKVELFFFFGLVNFTEAQFYWFHDQR